ncbi:hypothetical protein AB0M29_10795 [Streptomyces sp. NPDC051976]|uniref:hypothetical protein n=1 Tax=Streptomyces sp. NPDC051976 TaxID=3154947 RepID=UPI0034405FE4
MALSVSLLLVMLLVVGLMLRQKTVKPLPAVACALLGFLAASSKAAPAISQGINNIAQAIGNVHL